MKFSTTFASLALITMPIVACSDQAQQESSEAADAVGQDIERAGQDAADATERAADDVGTAASRVGHDETGAALENAGQRMQD
jgi:hypothetical protein